MRRTIIVAILCVFTVFPFMLRAEIHNVSVKNGFFNPNDLMIQPGDTVLWTDAPDLGECSYDPCPPVILHNVKADDLSFTSGPPEDGWTYQQTFDQPGEILYHCEVHSAPGKDINDFMNGRITVQAEMEDAFEINPGLNDAWFNLATAGQGFLITVFPVRKEVFLAWFTFDTERPPEGVTAILGEPGHRWLTAQGPYDGDTATLTIFMTKDGVFDATEPAASTDLAGDGTLTLEFADCTEGLVNYEITSLGISGEIPIERITPDNVALCETLGSP
jgi:plastocyanin